MTASFEQLQKQLADEFIGGSSDLETDEELGAAFLDFVLQQERLRRGVEAPGPEQEEVDRLTIERLYHQTELGHEHFFAESIFKRLSKDPANAIRHLREAVETRSALQSHRAQEPRQKDALGKVIDAWADCTEDLTVPKCHEELIYRRWTITEDEIRSPDGECFKASGLKDRIYRAKRART